MRKRSEWVAITLVLLLTGALRFWMLGEMPPGLSHDEVDHWLIARDILGGHHAIYFTAAYGHEPLYHYLQAATVALFGAHWLGLRFPSVAFGLLGLAITYVVIRHLFGASVALVTAGWLALSFWPLSYARVGLRAISLPFFAALSAYSLLRTVGLGRTGSGMAPDSCLVNPVLGGLALGLSIYTYMASRILPIILIAFLVYLFVVSSASVPWSRLFAFFLTAVVMSAPLLIWLATHPGAEYRIGEVREPLDRLLAGDTSLVWQNLIANLKSFFWEGDPWPHQNLPGRPIFADPASAVLFCAGMLITLRRWRTPQYGFLLIWLAGGLVPSIVSSVAPSSVRVILASMVTFAFPSLAINEAWRWLRSRNRLSAVARRALIVLPLTLTGLLTIRDYFVRWPRRDDVRYFYQTDLVTVAKRLDELSPETPITVAGLSVHSMDGPTLDLAARRDVHDVRLCDTRETLVIPDEREAWLFVPRIVPLDDDFLERLLRWGATRSTDPRSSFTAYHLSDDAALRQDVSRLVDTVALPDGTPVTIPVSFGGHLAFAGYEQLQQDAVPGGTIALLTYWSVEEPPTEPVKIFLHLIGDSDAPVAQSDGLASPPRGWASGDLIVQRHVISLPPNLPVGRYRLQVGIYDPVTNLRLPVLATDRLLLYSLEVQE